MTANNGLPSMCSGSESDGPASAFVGAGAAALPAGGAREALTSMCEVGGVGSVPAPCGGVEGPSWRFASCCEPRRLDERGVASSTARMATSGRADAGAAPSSGATACRIGG